MTGADRQNGPGGKERLTVMAGEVAAVCISEKKGTAKQNIGSCNFIEDWGLEKDAHAGNWHRQVSLLSWEEVEKFRARGANVADGAFGENLLVKDMILNLTRWEVFSNVMRWCWRSRR